MANRMNVLSTFVRGYQAHAKAWVNDAVAYNKIKFYPRRKETHVDPPITPSKVFMVHRVKPFKGNPYWEKDVLTKLGFSEREHEPVFVKNTPEVCSQLWRVKHLVKILPLKVPENLSSIDDSTEVFFHENGTCQITGKIDPARRQATEAPKESMKRLDRSTISEKLRLQWLTGSLI